MAGEDNRAQKFRFAGLFVPLLAICCGVIVALVALGVVDLVYNTFTHQRLFAGGPPVVSGSPTPANGASTDAGDGATATPRTITQ